LRNGPFDCNGWPGNEEVNSVMGEKSCSLEEYRGIISELRRNHTCLIIDGNRLAALEDGIVQHWYRHTVNCLRMILSSNSFTGEFSQIST
jgi:hypothetical protein